MHFHIKATTPTEKVIFFQLFPYKAYRTKVDLTIKQVKVNPGPFIQFQNNETLQMLHTKFKAAGPVVLEKKIFFNMFIIYGHGGHLGHVT